MAELAASRRDQLSAFLDKVSKGTALTGWTGIPAPRIANSLATCGFDAVTVDLQHGFHTEREGFDAIDQTLLGGAVAGLRIPVGRFDLASRALDAGAAFVIAPMINSASDARLFANAMKFPPMGERSWGPLRAMDAYGLDKDVYLASANKRTLALAMIETTAAIDAVDEILAVPGIDGVFVGPSDLSITLSGGAMIAPEDPSIDEAINYIRDRAEAAGKIPSIYAVTADRAISFVQRGFRLVAVAQDEAYLRQGAQAALAKVRAATE